MPRRAEPTSDARRPNTIGEAAAAAPTTAGVYFFLDEQQELVYIGKAGNIRRRLLQHAKAAAAGATPRDDLRRELVVDVRWEPCADEDAAAAREADLIVALRPLLNGAQASDGRWVYVGVEHDDGPPTIRLRLTADRSGGRTYGCFPHLGVGVSSRRAIACSEGYAALVRLLWAAGEPDAGASYPRAIAGPSPPADARVPFDASFEPDLHRLLSGSSARVLDDLLLVATGRRPAFMGPGLRRDHAAAAAFFAHGPRAVRELRLRHRAPVGPMSRQTIESFLVAELRAAIGDFVPPALGDPTDGLLGAREARARAIRADGRRRRSP